MTLWLTSKSRQLWYFWPRLAKGTCNTICWGEANSAKKAVLKATKNSPGPKGAESPFAFCFVFQVERPFLNASILLKSAVLSTKLSPFNCQTLTSQGNLHFRLQIRSSVLLRCHGDLHCFPTFSDAKNKGSCCSQHGFGEGFMMGQQST